MAAFAHVSVRTMQRAARFERLIATAKSRKLELLELKLRRLYARVEAGTIGLHPALDRAETMIAMTAVTRGPVDHLAASVRPLKVVSESDTSRMRKP